MSLNNWRSLWEIRVMERVSLCEGLCEELLEILDRKKLNGTRNRLTLREARDRQNQDAYSSVPGGKRRVRDSSSEARTPRTERSERKKAQDLRSGPDRFAANRDQDGLCMFWRAGLDGV